MVASAFAMSLDASMLTWLRIAFLASLLQGFACMVDAQILGQPLADEQGLYIELNDGLRLNLRIVDNHLHLYALDAAGKLVAPPFARAVVDLEDTRKRDKEHFVLRRESGQPWLSHPRFLRPPWCYEGHLVLYPSENSDEGRIIPPVLEFRQTP